VRKKCLRPLTAVAWMLVACASARAQAANGELRGEIKAEPGLTAWYRVTIDDPGRGATGKRAEMSADGSFVFRNLPYGSYYLRVATPDDQVIQQQVVIVGVATPRVIVQLQQAAQERPTGQVVSVQALRHPPSKKAFRAMAEAQKLSESGEYAEAAVQLELAIRESPWFAEAHTNLAAQRIRLRQNEEGLREANLAMSIAGPNARDLVNAAVAQDALQESGEAIALARRALQLEPASAKAHLLLGRLLAARRETLEEALLHLDRAAAETPVAKALAQRIRAWVSANRLGAANGF
jgi:tetratricopeptide (TPR) repeat protein